MTYQAIDCIDIYEGENIGLDGWLAVRAAELAAGGRILFTGDVAKNCPTCGLDRVCFDLQSSDYASYNLCLNCGDCRKLVYVMQFIDNPARGGHGLVSAERWVEMYYARKAGHCVWVEEYKPAPEQSDPAAPDGWHSDDDDIDWLEVALQADIDPVSAAADAADLKAAEKGVMYYYGILSKLKPHDLMMMNCLITLIETAPPDTIKAVERIMKDYNKEVKP